VLPAAKVSRADRRHPRHPAPRGLDQSQPPAAISPTLDQLLDKIALLRELTGKPVGVKTAIGGWQFNERVCDAESSRRGLEYAPDFLAIRTAAKAARAPRPRRLMDHRWPTLRSPKLCRRVIDSLIEYGLREPHSRHRRGQARHIGEGPRGAVRRRRFRQHRPRLHVLARCIQALRCTRYLSYGRDDANPACNAGSCRRKVSARRQYANRHEQEIDMIAPPAAAALRWD